MTPVRPKIAEARRKSWTSGCSLGGLGQPRGITLGPWGVAGPGRRRSKSCFTNATASQLSGRSQLRHYRTPQRSLGTPIRHLAARVRVGANAQPSCSRRLDRYIPLGAAVPLGTPLRAGSVEPRLDHNGLHLIYTQLTHRNSGHNLVLCTARCTCLGGRVRMQRRYTRLGTWAHHVRHNQGPNPALLSWITPH